MTKGTCKHYNGDWHNTHCLAGVCYRDVTSEPDNKLGIAFRKPCVNWEAKGQRLKLSGAQLEQWKKRGSCDKYEEPSELEIKVFEKEIDLFVKGVGIARKAIVDDLNARHESGKEGAILNAQCDPEVEDGPKNFVSGSGEIDCPVCEAGKLSYRRAAYNGHIHAKCSTKDCVAWME